MFRCLKRFTKSKAVPQKRILRSLRQEESACGDHCRRFALSDPADDDFKYQCLHDHTIKCESCKNLTNAIQSVEEKINELSSSM